MKKFCLLIFCSLLFSIVAGAQEKWDLERCIREALDKNLTIEQIKLTKEGYAVSGKQLRHERIPSLNVSSDLGLSFGRFINPATNDFETENSLYQSIGVGSGVMLYNGGRIRNSIRQNDLYVSASEKDIQQAEEDLALNIALAYLNVLFAYENVEIAKDRVELTERQLEHTEKLIEAGAKPENDRYDILSQIAIDEQGLITAQNDIDINLLSLKQQMLMEADFPLEIVRPILDLNTLGPLENEPFDVVYSSALGNQPQIQAAELREKANEIDVALARSQLIPSLSLGGNLGTNWSNVDKTPIGFITQRIPQTGVFINGNPALFELESEIPSGFEPVPYINQLDNNLGYGFGATLTIPILNNYASKGAVEKAKINVLNSNIETELIKQTLKTNIQNALASAKASHKTLDGAEASALAARIALENADRRFALGTLSNFEYLSARNRSDAAENNLLIARYDYYFQIKVIEYYMGRGIRLD